MKSKRTSKELQDLKHLGSKTPTYVQQYSPKLLESFHNQHADNPSWTTFHCPEFTSICPKTGQPDFATIVINYVANKKMVESKSLKLYLFSFRQHGGFHEDCVQLICKDLYKLMKPHFIEVIGKFTPRGGIKIHPYASMASSSKKYQKLKDERFTSYPFHP